MKYTKFLLHFVLLLSVSLSLACFEAKRDNKNDPNSPDSPYAGHPIYMDRVNFDFGYVQVGQNIDVSVNIISKENSVSVQSIQSSNSANFQVMNAPNLPMNLNMKNNINFTVKFSPTAPGPYSGTIDVVYRDTNGPKISLNVTGYSGTGSSSGPIAVNPGSYDFGPQTIGTESLPHEFTIHNGSTQQVSIFGIIVPQTQSNIFLMKSNPMTGNYILYPSQDLTFSMSFMPNAPGQVSTSLNITYSTYDSGQQSMPLILSGTGTNNTVISTTKTIYVRPSPNGSDINTGISTTQPLATITAAVNKSTAGDTIKVAAGNYSINSEIIISGMKLYGGYPDDGTWNEANRNGSSNYTTINDPRVGISTILVFQININSTNDTIIDGFRIVPGTGNDVTGIRINTASSSPAIKTVIHGNTINGGIATSSSTGILVYNNQSSATNNIEISANEIHGGTATATAASTNGISLNNIGTFQNITINIWNNVIEGGSATTTINGSSYGIYCNNFSPNIMNNTIDGGTASGAPSETDGIRISGTFNSSGSIINNLIYTSGGTWRYGIYKSDGSYFPSFSMDNNDIYNCSPGGLYHDPYFSTMADFNSINLGAFTNGSATVGSNNFNDTASFDPGLEWHLIGGAGNNPNIKDQGKQLTLFSTDKDGSPRSGNGLTGWSIGAYENDN